jgi:hypothetical protein
MVRYSALQYYFLWYLYVEIIRHSTAQGNYNYNKTGGSLIIMRGGEGGVLWHGKIQEKETRWAVT